MAPKKEKKYKIVLGSLYGDEGKGATVQWLCKKELDDKKKPVVIRYSGGAQAAHTIMQKLDNGKEIRHVCSSLGSGVLLGVDTYLDENFFLDPIMLLREIDTLQIEIAESGSPLGKDFMPMVWINDWCRIVTPYDIISNRKDETIKRNGTCGKGIWPTCKRYSEKFYVNPLKKISVKCKELSVTEIFKNPQAYLDKVKAYYNFEQTEFYLDQEYTKSYTVDELDWMFCDAIERINKIIERTERIKIREEDFRRSGLYDTIIYEGSQGLLLDAHNGFDPWTTASLVGLNGIPSSIVKNKDLAAYEQPEVYLVIRTYLTRHGKGIDENHIKYNYGDRYFQACLIDEYEYNVENYFQGVFNKVVFDTRLFYRAIDRHILDNYQVRFNLVITHADAIDRYVRNVGASFPEGIKLPYFFNSDEKITDFFPVIDKDGKIEAVHNIHEFRYVVTKEDVISYPYQRLRFMDIWYSDNPYSEFKRC